MRKYIFFFVAFCTAASHSAPAQQPVNSIVELKDSIRRIMSERHMPNLMLTLVSKDSILFSGGFGLVNLSTKKPVSGKTLFPMGSVTKTFTSLAIQLLITNGKLSFDTRLKDLAPEVPFTNVYEKMNPLTIGNLLEHTSGFDDVHFNALFNREQDSSQYHAVLKFRKSMICRWYPGERTAYCNTDYVILGYLIEKLSRESYPKFLKKNILDPIGMNESNCNELYTPGNDYAQGYKWDGSGYSLIPPLHIYGKGEGGLYSCADDMARFLMFLLNDANASGRQLLKPSTIAQMETPHTSIAAQAGLTTGYGSGISAGYFDLKYPFYGHDGLTTDFSTRYGYNRQLGLAFAVCGADAEPFSELIINFMTRNTASPKLPDTLALDNSFLDSFQGYYRLKTPRFQILRYLEEVFHGYHIELRRSQLYCYGFKRPVKQLLPVTTDIFRKAGENSPTMLLTMNKQGKRLLYECGTYFEKVPFSQILAERFLLFSGLVSAIALIISLPVWLIMAFLKKISWLEFRKRSLSGWATVLLFSAFAIFAYLAAEPENIGTLNVLTASYFAGTLLFAFLNTAGLIVHLGRFRRMHSRVTKWYLVITSMALLYLTIFLYHYDLLGLRLWDF